MSAVRTTCPYCGVGCGLRVEPRDRAVEIAADPEHPANFGRLCSKGSALGETLGSDGRLLFPEVGGARTDWATALDTVADGLAHTIRRHGPDAVAFYLSGQLLTEDYYVANKLMKGFIGSANVDTNSRLCMASAVAGYTRAFGEDLVPGSYADLEAAELLVIVGSNTAWCHPVLFQRIRRAKEANPDIKVAVVDPRRTATADVADLFLPIAPGTDVPLFNGLLTHLSREDALDFEYIDAHTEGFGRALAAARASAPSIAAVARACGVPEPDVAELYHLFACTDKVVTLFSQGVNQSSSGTDKVNSIVNAHLATGRIGKPGAGPFSLTGQPNAMGGREVGGLANQLAAHMDFSPEHVERVGRFWNAPQVAHRPGLKAVELFEAVHAGRIKALWIMSTNPVVSMPDADRVAEALRRCELVIVSDCVRSTDTNAYADVLLPAAAWGEKSGTVTNSERRISRQRSFLPPAGESRPDWWIVTEVARRMGFGPAFPYRAPSAIFREHARLSGFENDGTRVFDIGALADLGDADYEGLEPVQWPVSAGSRTAARRLFADGRYATPSGKARLVAVEPRPPVHSAGPHRPFVLNTGRVRDHWHTMTRSGRSARLSGYHVEPFVQVHPADAERLGLRSGMLAELAGERCEIVARVEVTTDVRPGQLFVPMHWNDQHANRARVGTLIPSAVDPVSGQPELKAAPVSLRPHGAAWYGFALSRNAVSMPGCTYVARAKGQGHWRYELAGREAPASWPAWARESLGAEGEDRELEWIEFSDAGSGRYRGAILHRGRLRACLFIAAGQNLPDRGWLGKLFAADDLDPAARASLLAARPTTGGAPSGGIVCSCFSVGRSVLVEAIRTQSLVTTQAIGAALGAGTSCGSCLPDLRALLADAAPATSSDAPLEALRHG
jgi:assimilatory nitrate reductase catalytic subunit